MAFVTKECKCIRNAPLAQLDRAFGYGPKGRGFESSNARTKKHLQQCKCFFLTIISFKPAFYFC